MISKLTIFKSDMTYASSIRIVRRKQQQFIDKLKVGRQITLYSKRIIQLRQALGFSYENNAPFNKTYTEKHM